MDQTTLQNIETIVQEGTILAGLLAPLAGPIAPDVALGAKIATALETIILQAMAAHQAALGSPIDLSKLHTITPVT